MGELNRRSTEPEVRKDAPEASTDSASVDPEQAALDALQKMQGGPFRSPVERASGNLPQTRETSGLGVTAPHDHETAQDEIERLRGRFDPMTGTFPDDRRYEGREPKTVEREDPGEPR